jgi:hypothetical protein
MIITAAAKRSYHIAGYIWDEIKFQRLCHSVGHRQRKEMYSELDASLTTIKSNRSNNNFGRILDRNAIPNANTMYSIKGLQNNKRQPTPNISCIMAESKMTANAMLSRGANTIERRPTSNTSCILVESKMAAREPEVVITLLAL